MKSDVLSIWRRLVPRIPAVAATLLVLSVYVFIGSTGTFSFRRVPWDREFPELTEGYYARLAESFLHSGRT